MFDEQLSKIPTEPPRSPALLPGLMIWRAIFHTGLWAPLAFAGLFSLLPISVLFTQPAARLSFGHSKTAAGVQPGDSVPVKFLVDDPSVNRIADDREGPGDTLLPLFIFPIFFIVFLIGPVSIPRFIQLLRDRRIFRKGKLTNAFVLFVRPRGVFSWFGWSGLYSANVYVRFQLGFGDYAEVKKVCKNDWLLNHLAPDALVHIVYLPNRPSRAVLLETYVRSPSAGFLLG